MLELFKNKGYLIKMKGCLMGTAIVQRSADWVTGWPSFKNW